MSQRLVGDADQNQRRIERHRGEGVGGEAARLAFWSDRCDDGDAGEERTQRAAELAAVETGIRPVALLGDVAFGEEVDDVARGEVGRRHSHHMPFASKHGAAAMRCKPGHGGRHRRRGVLVLRAGDEQGWHGQRRQAVGVIAIGPREQAVSAGVAFRVDLAQRRRRLSGGRREPRRNRIAEPAHLLRHHDR